jgi:small subunit ribosomal protein S8
MARVIVISTDPIADMLTRIRNAIAVNKNVVSMPHSKGKETVAKILANSGFIADVKVTEDRGRKTLEVVINSEDESAKITEINRLSRPGRRIYVKSDEIPTVKRGRGMVVISTSSGVMSGKDAKNKHLGGELICEVY